MKTCDPLGPDHAAIEGLLDAVIGALDRGDREVAGLRWADFERALVEHFTLEERSLLPGLMAARPREGRVLIQEHSHLQRRAAQLRDSLASLTPQAARTFRDELRAHGAHEAKVLYRWAEERACPPPAPGSDGG